MTISSFLTSHKLSFIPSSGGRELRIVCPLCKNPKQKCHVNAATGNWYCFHCGIGGSFSHLRDNLHLKDTGETIEATQEDKSQWTMVSPVDEEIVDENQQRLLSMLKTDIGLQKYLHEDRGYTIQTIQDFKLGWNGKALIIPIYNSSGQCVNFKIKSDPTRPIPAKGMYSIDGRGKKALFNEKVLLNKTKKDLERIIICEGEWDAMLLTQLGYSAVTSTAGAQSFDEAWVSAFKKYDKVYICFDNDRNNVGQAATKKTADLFLKQGIRPFLIRLPAPTILEEKVDITDFFTRQKKTKTDFTMLLKEAQEYTGRPLSSELYSFHSFKDVSEMDFPQQRWLVENLIPMGGITCIAGVPGSMKSYFSQYMASCISQGSPVLDTYQTQKVPILMIDKENLLQDLNMRFNLLKTPIEARDDIHYMKGDFLIEKQEAVQQVELAIQRYGIKLTIIDSLVRMHSGNENSAEDTNKLYQVIKRLQTAGSGVLFVHHFNKQGFFGTQTDIRSLLRGSVDILGQVDSFLGITRQETGLYKIETGKGRNFKALPPFLMQAYFDEDETSFYHLGDAPQEEEMQEFVVENELVKIAAAKRDITRKEFIDEIGKKAHSRTIDRGLQKLIERGVLVKTGNTNKVKYNLSLDKKREVEMSAEDEQKEKLTDFN